MEAPPKRGSVVSPAGENGERGMIVVRCSCEEGENCAGGKGSGGQESRTGEEEEEKNVQAAKGGGNEVGSDDGKAFSTGRGG